MKKVKARLEKENPGRVDKFAKGANAKIKEVLDNFKDWDMYTGESRDQDGIVVLVNYREDGVTAYGIIWKDGVYEEKVVRYFLHLYLKYDIYYTSGVMQRDKSVYFFFLQ